MPWILEQSVGNKKIQQLWPEQKAFIRLYALGTDAFLLHSRLLQLQRVKSSNINGVTGQLQLNDQQHIVRKSRWGKIIKGVAHSVEP